MRVQLSGVGKYHGAQKVLDQVSLTIGQRARIGLVGPNGVSKTTLLRLLARLDAPDTGSVAHAPSGLVVGYLAQERELLSGETVLDFLARRAGVAAAEAELEEAATELARLARAEDRYSVALERFLALGGGDFEARAHSTCADLGLRVRPDRYAETLSGGERARADLAAILLSRFDLHLLDEPTNHLDLEAVEQLEAALLAYDGTLVVVTHDRRFLKRVAPSREIGLQSS